MALKAIEKQIRHELLDRNVEGCPLRSQEDKCRLMCNLLHGVDRALDEGRISRSVQETLLRIFVDLVIAGDPAKRQEFAEQYGLLPPGLLTISPAKQCNLRCSGCYSSSSSSEDAVLDYDIVSRVVTEQKQLWGSHFTVISGGEPLAWRSRGKDILDLAAAHPDTYFQMFTNGTLIDEEMAERMGDAGNLSPAISIEGFEKETDARRGKGTHQRILRALEYLRKAGVPFGVSITATRDNAELIVSDPFVDYCFAEQGVIYAWIFQYMPVGRHYTLGLMVTPEQRLHMYRRMQWLIRERGVFLADFWNSGAASNGCIAGGRSGGYLYIDWNGNVSPCVFFPYAFDNIVQVYEKGGNLNTVVMSPYFEAIRRWQSEYGYRKPPDRVGNQIVPCPIRDHHLEALGFVRQFGARPMDEAAAEALEDESYHRGLAEYGQAFEALTRGIWEEEYLRPERERASCAKKRA
jgi:MoaA/NifB/PqqE/SkfB family radical SAM enzyme